MEKKGKILIIEDDESTINIYTFALKKYFEINAARTSQEFQNLIKIDKYCLFIVDLALKNSEKDGIDLVYELRTNEAYKDTPIFVVTGQTLNFEEQKSIVAGATEFLRKPIDLKKLIDDAAVYATAC